MKITREGKVEEKCEENGKLKKSNKEKEEA